MGADEMILWVLGGAALLVIVLAVIFATEEETEPKIIGTSKIKCPVDGKQMQVIEFDDDLHIDKCPQCGGVWLDPNELETIIENIESDNGSNFTTGLAVGMIIG